MTIRRFRIDTPYEGESEFLEAGLASRGWQPTEGADWHLLWSTDIPTKADCRLLGPDRRINHFPGSITLHFKDELHHFLVRAAARLGTADGRYDFFPRTYSMPGDFDTWRRAAAAEPEAVWIRKPKRLSGGIGVSLFTGHDAARPDDDYIIQEYVADPLMLPEDPYKHIMRIYAVVTSLDPLVAYLHTDGPVKFTSRPYGTTPEQLADPVVHITNPHVQRTNDQVPDPVRATGIPEYLAQIRRAKHDDILLWDRIRSILAQTLIAHREPMLKISTFVCDHLSSCFELLGFDILIDAGLRPWLIEANVGPALGARGARGSPHRAIQRRAKAAMVGDTLDLIGAGPGGFTEGSAAERFRAERARRGGFEVLYPADDTAALAGCFETLRPADKELLGG